MQGKFSSYDGSLLCEEDAEVQQASGVLYIKGR